MSVYTNIHGELTLSSTEASAELQEYLIKYKYAALQDGELFFIDELGDIQTHGYDEPILANNVLTIPLSLYRNMRSAICSIALRLNAKGSMYYFTSDGNYIAGCYLDGKQKIAAGRDAILDVIRQHIQDDLEFYSDLLSMSEEDYDSKYPDEDCFQQSLYGVLEMASTMIGNTLLNSRKN